MGLKRNFSPEDFRAALEQKFNLIDEALVQALSELGEELVNHARQLDTYKDQTGNLRASIGYVIVIGGQIKSDYFPDPKFGAEVGKNLADRLARYVKKGVTLIVVAGMNYADAVEARGLDVIASAELLSMQKLPGLKAKMMQKIEAMK